MAGLSTRSKQYANFAAHEKHKKKCCWPKNGLSSSQRSFMSLLGPVAALYSPMIDVCAKIKRAAACFISQVYHQCKQIVYNFYAISFVHFFTVRKCNSIPLFSQKYVFFWSHHHKYFLSERLRLNTFYEYCKDLKPKLFYFPVHFSEQTLDHFSDKLTLKGFWQVWLRDNFLFKMSKNDANHLWRQLR